MRQGATKGPKLVEQNPIGKLLDALPSAIANEKRLTIQNELIEAGMWEHYRQNISKPGRDIGKTNIRTAVILQRHLGLSTNFFINPKPAQDEEIRKIIQGYYTQTLKE